RSTRLKDVRKSCDSKRKSLLSTKRASSNSGGSAAVHHVQMDLLIYADKAYSGDCDHAMVRTVGNVVIAGVTTRDDDGRMKPRPQEESQSDERVQSLCLLKD
ncbi:MAG: hypothetical protein ACQET3_04195, partial [Promethearchaeati archaeon]